MMGIESAVRAHKKDGYKNCIVALKIVCAYSNLNTKGRTLLTSLLYAIKRDD